MPIIDRQDAKDVEEQIKRIFAAAPSARADELRRLFVEKLDFLSASGPVSLAGAPKNVVLPTSAERLATLEGVNAVFVPLSIEGTQRVRRAEAAVAARLIRDQLGEDLLLVMTNTDSSQLHFIYPTFVSTTPSLRRMIIERDLPRRTAVQQLSNIYWNWKDTGSILTAIDGAFDVEKVTRDFFTEYRRVFEQAMELVQGFASDDDGLEEKRMFVQTLFNRLMFVYFISRKGWLTFNGSKDYLNALWADYLQHPGDSSATTDRNFVRNRLHLLFTAGLNNPQCRDLMRDNPVAAALIGDVHFLNGGLFDDLDGFDARVGAREIEVPDEVIPMLLRDSPGERGLFNRFNFTVTESTPFDVEVAVDPEMLGKVFEELVTERHKTGAFYTPRPIVSFMCRAVLKGYLLDQVGHLSADAVHLFVEQKDTSGLDVTLAPEVGRALESITVLDPACGSGAYLVGMMHELIELESLLYSERLLRNPKTLYALKLRLIQDNLFGADIDSFAVNIAMLRLWLSLAIDFEGTHPEPLPNLDFKIVRGDSLVSPEPSVDRQGLLFADRARGLAEQLDEAKNAFITAIGAEKDSLRHEIVSLQRRLSDALEEGMTDSDAVHWHAAFSEVFERRAGFDIIITNPPYEVVKSPALRVIYQEGVYGRMNTYGLFIQRSLELMHDGSRLAFINPRTLLTDRYFGNLRRLLKRRSQLDQVVIIEDRHNTFTRVLQACILLFLTRRSKPARDHNVQTRRVFRPTDLNEYCAPYEVPAGRVMLGAQYDDSFFIANESLAYDVFEQVAGNGASLLDLGLVAKTGPIQFDKYAEYSLPVNRPGFHGDPVG